MINIQPDLLFHRKITKISELSISDLINTFQTI